MTFKTAKNKNEYHYRGKNQINQTKLFNLNKQMCIWATVEIVSPYLPTTLSMPYINKKNNIQTVCN